MWLCGENILVFKQVRLKLTLYLVIFICSIAPDYSHSQPLIEELERLSFGTLAIPSNASVSRYTFPYTGNNALVEGRFVELNAGRPGRYRLSGFPAFTPLSVTLNTSTLTAAEVGLTEPLTVDNYEASQTTTDEQGNAELSLGARLNTSGSGNGYADSSYSGSSTLRIEYWQPDVNAYVFNARTVELEADLASTIELSEEQQLHFGTLYARTSMTEQAVMTLAPSGAYSITEPEGTRLVVLARPEQAVIKVSGAAPFNSLSITPQSTEVLLEHTEFPGSAPHFILSNMVTSPDATGKVDVNGELLISIGGTLKTELTVSPVVYPSGEYEGMYELTVSY